MTTRFLGLVPALALLAAGTAHAQVQNQTGSMAFPESNPSGQVQVQAPTARDTGNMAFPASPGGVASGAPRGADTGNMATPSGRGNVVTRRAAPQAHLVAARGGDPANSMRPDVAPTPAQTATAQALDSAPSAAPVPYTDFLPPEKPAGKVAVRKRSPIHHAVAKRAAPPATPAAAAPAPAAPAAAAPAAPAK